MKFRKRCESKKEPPIDDEIKPTETLVNYRSATKALKLYTTLSSTLSTNCFTPMFKRKLNNLVQHCNRPALCVHFDAK